jgi:hypothetical protein
MAKRDSRWRQSSFLTWRTGHYPNSKGVFSFAGIKFSSRHGLGERKVEEDHLIPGWHIDKNRSGRCIGIVTLIWEVLESSTWTWIFDLIEHHSKEYGSCRTEDVDPSGTFLQTVIKIVVYDRLFVHMTKQKEKNWLILYGTQLSLESKTTVLHIDRSNGWTRSILSWILHKSSPF